MTTMIIFAAFLLAPSLAAEVSQHPQGFHPSLPLQEHSNATNVSPPPSPQHAALHQLRQQTNGHAEIQGAEETSYYIPQAKYQSYQAYQPAFYQQETIPMQLLNYVEYQPDSAEAEYLPYQVVRPEQLTAYREPRRQEYSGEHQSRRTQKSTQPTEQEEGYVVRYSGVPQPAVFSYGPAQSFMRIFRNAQQIN